MVSFFSYNMVFSFSRFAFSMSIIAWKARGVSNPTLRKMFKDLARTYKLDNFVVSQRGISGRRGLKIIRTLSYSDLFIKDTVGFSSGFRYCGMQLISTQHS